MDFKADMTAYLEKEIEVLRALNLNEINDSINAMLLARERGGTIYIMGNGGSAATASHMASDFNKGVNEALQGKKFHFECLNDNMPIVMAVANDIGYEEIFVFQLRNKLEKNDLVIGISGSGNSENVVRAMKYAKEMGVKTIGITGYTGGKVKELADYRMHVNINDMQIAEDVHMIFDHMLMRVIGRIQPCK